MENKPLILIIEDEKMIREFLGAKLETEGMRILMSGSGREGISLASSHCPDLILLDLGLPDIDGMEVLQKLRSWSHIPVIVVSARQQEEDIVLALDSGANDYVTKPFSNSVLMARIRTALRASLPAGTSQPGGTELAFAEGDLRINFEKRLVIKRGEKLHLTPVEYKIFVLLSRNAGRVITYATIRRELWGPYTGDNRAVRVNMANLRRKIEDNPADPHFILTEVGVGYRMIDADTSTVPVKRL